MAEKNPFFRRIFPLWFNSKLKKDCGFQKPNFPKNFFDLMKPGDLGHLVCLRSRASKALFQFCLFYYMLQLSKERVTKVVRLS